MDVRRLAPDEWASYRAIRLRALADAPDAFGATYAAESVLTEDDWRTRLEAADWATFVIDGGFSPTAMAVGGPAHDVPAAAALYGMWVAPDVRGRGLGAALIDAVHAWAVDNGYSVLVLGVTTTNAPAIALYERVAFVATGDRYPLRDDSDLQIQIMARPLRPA